MLDRRHFIAIGSASAAATLAVAVAGTAEASPAFKGSNSYSASLPPTAMTDADLNNLIRALDNLPEHLKTAAPKTTPNYEKDLSKALNGLKVGHVPAPTPGVATPMVNWVSCTWEVAQVIVSYGIPVGKVIGWLKKAKSLYGSIRGIFRAFKTGLAAADIGEDAVQILEMILGFDGVINACFS